MTTRQLTTCRRMRHSYCFSFTDAYIAMAYRSLTKEEQARFDPMITGTIRLTCTPPITFAGCCRLSRCIYWHRRVLDSQGIRID